MALTNPQYDAIMRMYNERQLRHQREQQEHIRIAYEKIPRLAEIDAEIASLSVRKAKAMLNGDASMDLDLNLKISSAPGSSPRRSSAISARRLKISSFTATPVSEKRFFRTVLPAS